MLRKSSASLQRSSNTSPAGDPPPPEPRLAYHHGLPVQALLIWMRENLSVEPTQDGGLHFYFRFLGSTCSWGGQRINSLMHAIVRPSGAEHVFEKGWIDLPLNEPGTHFSCAWQQRNYRFIDEIKQSPHFTGQTLESILTSGMDLNPAGCFCKPPMVNHKWRVMVATIHYALGHGLLELELAS